MELQGNDATGKSPYEVQVTNLNGDKSEGHEKLLGELAMTFVAPALEDL
jgi:hypothetical protein